MVKNLHHKKKLSFLCMYKMSKGTERLTKERKVTVKTYTKNKIHENLAYKIIRYINLRVIEADYFRKKAWC